MSKTQTDRTVDLGRVATATERKNAPKPKDFHTEAYGKASVILRAALVAISPPLEAFRDMQAEYKGKLREFLPAICQGASGMMLEVLRCVPQARQSIKSFRAQLAPELDKLLTELPTGGKDAEGKAVNGPRERVIGRLSALIAVGFAYPEGGPLQRWAKGNYNGEKDGLDMWYRRVRENKRRTEKMTDAQIRARIESVIGTTDAPVHRESRDAVIAGLLLAIGADERAKLVAGLEKVAEPAPQVDRPSRSRTAAK
jgi:hypothetical protein